MTATTVTISSGSAPNLYTLVTAIQPGVGASYSQIILTADSANTGNIFVGDSTVSTTIYGTKLAASGSVPFPASAFNGLAMESFYLTTDGTSQKVHVLAQRM